MSPIFDDQEEDIVPFKCSFRCSRCLFHVGGWNGEANVKQEGKTLPEMTASCLNSNGQPEFTAILVLLQNDLWLAKNEDAICLWFYSSNNYCYYLNLGQVAHVIFEFTWLSVTIVVLGVESCLECVASLQITLWLWGSVANFLKEPCWPRLSLISPLLAQPSLLLLLLSDKPCSGN